jgi:hypothetical protein
MGFLGVYKAIYDYAPQGAGELSITEGDILYVLEKSEEDDWWKAKKKASGDDDDEPVGLIPSNYIEEVRRHWHPYHRFELHPILLGRHRKFLHANPILE